MTEKKPNGTIVTVPNGFGWKVIFVPYEPKEAPGQTEPGEEKEG